MRMRTGSRLLHIFILVSSTVWLTAQETDHVYLKTGSVIRGNILEIDPADHVKIQDLCGNIWYYQIAQVEKITSEPYMTDQTGNYQNLDFKKGFVNMTSLGFLAGSANNMQVAPFSLVTVNGWRNSIGLFTGAGIGIEFLSTNYMPLFLDLRYDILGTDVVPYIMAKGGYSLPLSSDHSEYDIEYEYSGGPLVGAGMSLSIKTRNHFAWDIGLIYRYQQASYVEKYGWNGQEYTYTDYYNRIEMHFC